MLEVGKSGLLLALYILGVVAFASSQRYAYPSLGNMGIRKEVNNTTIFYLYELQACVV